MGDVQFTTLGSRPDSYLEITMNHRLNLCMNGRTLEHLIKNYPRYVRNASEITTDTTIGRSENHRI